MMSKKKMNKRKRISVSPSQIKDYEHDRGGCNRLWAFKKIDRVPFTQSWQALFGTKTHVPFEDYFKDGVKSEADTPHAKVFRMGIESGEYPEPEPNVFDVEKRFEIKIGEIEHEGEIYDVYVWGDPDLADPGVEGGPAFVWDNKTTGDFRWKLSDEALAEDVQSISYAAFMANTYQATVVKCKWIYLHRDLKGVRTAECTHLTTEETFLNEWKKIETVSMEIARVRLTAEKAMDLPYNLAACKNYGGCDFGQTKGKQCKLPSGSSLLSGIARDSRKNKSAEKKAKGPASAGNQEKKSNKTLTPKGKGETLTNTVASIGHPTEQGGKPMGLTERLEAMKDQAAKDAEINSGTTEATAETAPKEMKTAKPKPGSVEAKAIAQAEVDAEIEEATAQIKAKREAEWQAQQAKDEKKAVTAQKRKEKAAAKKAASKPDVAPASEPSGGDDESPEETPTAHSEDVHEDGLTVYFDCFPRKGGNGTENLTEWIKPLADFVAEKEGVPHFGLVDWGKGPAALAAALDKALTERPQNKHLLVDTYSIEGKAVKDVLIRHAVMVVQGMR